MLACTLGVVEGGGGGDDDVLGGDARMVQLSW